MGMIEIKYADDMIISIDEKFHWLPSYEDVRELFDIDASSCTIYGGWKGRFAFAEWYAREVECISEEMIDFVDKVSLANWLIEEKSDILLELKSGAIVQLDVGLYKI